MSLSLKTHGGEPDRPAVVLIHGLGMNNYFWQDPEKCFVLGGLAPLTVFLGSETAGSSRAISFGAVDPDLEGLWNCLKRKGYALASWTQGQPLGPMRPAVAELKEVLDRVRRQWPGRSIFLVGHSRGGLMARSCLAQETPPEVAGLITICSPHSGTGMAKYSRYLKPAGRVLEKILPEKSKADLTRALSRLSAFLQSPAIAELQPGSEYMASLPEKLPQQLPKLSFGGTDPALFHIIVRLPGDNRKVIKFPDLLARAIPSAHLPVELTPGRGDALVSAASARLPGADHHDFPANHVKAAFEKDVHQLILDFLQS